MNYKLFKPLKEGYRNHAQHKPPARVKTNKLIKKTPHT
jgi:hypothetical protein